MPAPKYHLPLGVQEAESKRLMLTVPAHVEFPPDTRLFVVNNKIHRLRQLGYQVSGEFTDVGGYILSVLGSPR